MSWEGKEEFSLLEERGVHEGCTPVKKAIELEKHELMFSLDLYLLKGPIFHKIFSVLRRLINGHLSW